MIRSAAPSDYPAIRAILRHAFDGNAEADLVEQLRADGDVLFELVEASAIALQAHLLYSRLRIERGGETIDAAALAPVAVLPSFQRRGIGGRLIQAGNARCREMGVPVILVLGHEDFYPRFGFNAKTAESLDAPFSGPTFMALELQPGCLAGGGHVRYAAAFGL